MMRLEGEAYGIDVGTLVMNSHHGLVRFGVVREKNLRDHGWAHCQVDWFEDDIYVAKVAWDKKMNAATEELEEVRVDYLTPISPDWLRNVLYAYRRYNNE